MGIFTMMIQNPKNDVIISLYPNNGKPIREKMYFQPRKNLLKDDLFTEVFFEVQISTKKEAHVENCERKN